MSYNDFVALTVISNTLTLSRLDLKKMVRLPLGNYAYIHSPRFVSQLITAPEVVQVLPEIPILADLMKNLYESHYDKLFIALAQLEQTLLPPPHHTQYYMREMQILTYSQLLESYRSLTLESLSGAFRVSVDFVNNELSRFIISGRLHCSIDEVNGIVETNRPALKNAQYETVKQGDLLLNSVRRLKVLH